MPRDADIAVRSANPSDLGAIHAIELESFPQPWREEFFAHELALEGRVSLVAELEGVVIGYVFAMWILDEMHVNKIAVDERARRKGVAVALMEHCLDFARRHHIAVISLEVRDSNHGAQDFYRHLGFASAYRRRRYYPDGEDAVVMTLNVASTAR